MSTVQSERAAISRSDRETSSAGKLPPIDPGALHDSIVFSVLRANRILQQFWTTHWGEHEFRPMFYSAFVLIGMNPGISLVELARYVAIDKSRASELIDSLEREQLIVRRRSSDDHRRHGLYLTPNATTRLASMSEAVERHEQRFRELFTAVEQRQLIELLERFAQLHG